MRGWRQFVPALLLAAFILGTGYGPQISQWLVDLSQKRQEQPVSEVSELAYASLIVSGAGEDAVNGEYTYGGLDFWGHDYWFNATNGFYLGQSTDGNGTWQIVTGPGPNPTGEYYTTGTDVLGPWTVNWGAAPAPTVSLPGPPPTRSVGGAVTAGGVGIAGVPVTATLSGVARSAITDLNGNYVISGLTSGSWEIALGALDDYTFSPASQAVTVDTGSSNVTGVNFTASSPTTIPEPVAWEPLEDNLFDDPDLVLHTLSGTVKDSTGAGISGAQVLLFVGTVDSVDAPRSVTTGTDGTFSFLVTDGAYTLYALSDAFSFTALAVTVSGGDQTGQDLAGVSA